ncbi:MAG: DNA mismatch repair protein MutS [Acidobacteriota bacterium]|nr:DNA mismatch repair protein MutS [Acidobacteriota bacterium]
MGPAFEEYQARLRQRQDRIARLDRADQIAAAGRLVLAAAGALLAWLAFGAHAISGLWLLAPGAAFVALAVHHGRVLGDRDAARRAAGFYTRGLDRLADRWTGTGATGARFLDDTHLYARDLDLFGDGSLFQLLSTATTPAGEETLARWLRQPAAPPEIAARQAAIRALGPNLALREDLAVLGPDAVVPGAAAPADWGARPVRLDSAALRIAALLLALSAVVTTTGWWAFDWGYVPLAIVLVLEGLLALPFRPVVHAVLSDLDDVTPHLRRLGRLLARLEREAFDDPRLNGVQQRLFTGGHPASAHLARLERLVVLLDSRRNQFFAPIAAALLWSTQLACAVDAWRRQAGPAVAGWLEAVGEFEALAALAGYSYEHPDDPFPAIDPSGPVFDGEGLGHPLIPEAHCTRNDVRLGGGAARVLLVSGSNMSGKSTLLRTVGLATVLGLAGAPVRATRLRLSPLAVGATLRIEDSLQAGRSRFYAEITRLREIVDLARQDTPVLFLLDEIFHGTNSHDRRLGAEAVVRSLMRLGAVGLVTTHDLALTELAEASGGALRNVHFEDQLQDGRMTFDYRVREGIVQTSNALALMKAVGLEVGDD